MTELFLVVSNFLFGASILLYFFFREINKDPQEHEDKEMLADFFSENVLTLRLSSEKNMDTLVSISKSKDELFQKTLIEYLKHNERLEKMILPQPVTKRAVQDILDQVGPMVENDIEKSDEDLDKEQLEDLLGRLPITAQTKVAFEEDMMSGGGALDEEIEDTGISSDSIN